MVIFIFSHDVFQKPVTAGSLKVRIFILLKVMSVFLKVLPSAGTSKRKIGLMLLIRFVLGHRIQTDNYLILGKNRECMTKLSKEALILSGDYKEERSARYYLFETPFQPYTDDSMF